jgi:glycerol dehydrogenase
VPTMAAMLHGELVAFGTLVQVIVEERSEAEVTELLSLLQVVNLPVTFKQLGQSVPLTRDEMLTVLNATLAAAYSKNMQPPLTAERLENALLKADSIGAALRTST